jgi:arylsulfatase A-like enzyme
VLSSPIRRLSLLALLAASALACGDGNERASVLLVTIDTLRADRLGAYGAAPGSTPNLDALAAQSVIFERAIAGAGMTAPSHAAILTSRYTREHSVGFENGFAQLEGTPTIAERFYLAGYRTAGFVGNINLTSLLGFDRGFEIFDDQLVQAEKHRPGIFERIAEQTTERALAWLEPTQGPVFLWVHLQDPHGPYEPPEPYRGRTPVVTPPGEQPLPLLGNDSGRGGIPRYQQIEGMSLPSLYEGRYADEILYTDHWLGVLLGAFDRHEPDRPKVVLVTADHGEALGEDNRYFVHGMSTLPHLARVPMLLRAPGLAPERRSELVSHVDVMPTLLALSGIEGPAKMSGLALSTFLGSDTPLPERSVYCDNGSEVTAYRGDGFLRVARAGGAYRGTRVEPRRAPRVRRFSWDGAGTWLPKGRAPLPEDVRRYIEQAVPIAVREVSAPHLERLRALGYID